MGTLWIIIIIATYLDHLNKNEVKQLGRAYDSTLDGMDADNMIDARVLRKDDYLMLTKSGKPCYWKLAEQLEKVLDKIK